MNDDILMAYADGELDAATRAAVERALQDDPALAEKVAEHQALRSDVFAAFAPVLDEPVPPRLLAAAMPGKVMDLAASRRRPAPRRWSLPEWGALAASVVVGVLTGSLMFSGGGASVVREADGTLAARGALAQALNQQLAATGGPVKIGVSFADRDGVYCRSFMLNGAAGLACRSGKEWKLPVLVDAPSAGASEYRQAGSEMPSAVLDAIDARIAGQPLDAAGERAAQQRGWERR